MIIRYASHNLRFIQPTQTTSKSAPKFLPESQERVPTPMHRFMGRTRKLVTKTHIINIIKQDVGFYLHQEGPNLGKTSCPLSPVTICLVAQFGAPYPRSAGFDTNSAPMFLPESQERVPTRMHRFMGGTRKLVTKTYIKWHMISHCHHR